MIQNTLVRTIRIAEEDWELVKKAAGSLGIATVDFIRMAVRKELARRGYITGEEAKALEV